MPFCLYRVDGQDLVRVRPVSMGGKNTIYGGWVRRGSPLDQGWHMNSDEIISQTEKGGTYHSHRIIIDLEPKAPRHVILLEILDIYAFTYALNNEPDWTALMFRMRDAFFHQEAEMDAAKKENLKQRFQPIDDKRDIFEFVYLQGNWNPGGVGGWNAPLLHPESLAYFKQFF
ncbi:MAG: hypothetical protein ACLP5H_09815 [Desulfomonilaceae bacterium]